MNNSDAQDNKIDRMNAMIRALDNTGVRMFMYYPQSKTIKVPEKTCAVYQCRNFYANMPYDFAEDYVYEEDYEAFNEMYFKIDRGEKTATATFHSKDLKYCNQVTLTTVSWTKDQEPEEVFGLIENLSDLYRNEQLVKMLQMELSVGNVDEDMNDAIKTISLAIGKQYYALYYIYIDTHSYICFQEKIKGKLSLIQKKGDYNVTWEAYISNNIEKSTRDILRKFGDLSTIEERMGSRNIISCDYYRQGLGWTRGQFIVGKRDENGHLLTVIFTVSDINEEIKVIEEKHKAELETLQDSMTKLWNRKAFEQFKEDDEYKKHPVGIVLFDIDRFKAINDQFGHEVGDQVIKETALVVNSFMRKRNRAFRIGGDEFAVLLYDCSENIWSGLCKAIEMIHAEIRKALPHNINVTLSAGICINQNGYCDEMYNLADKAMYNTKANGRGGCSFIDLEGTITGEWHDNSSYLRKGDALEKNSTVSWRMEIPKDKNLPVRVYGDDIYLKFVGVDGDASPEEIHNAVMRRLEPEYAEIVEEAIKATITEGEAEVVYYWNHPEKGRVQLRRNSSLDYETNEYYSLVGYNHILKEKPIFTLENINRKIQVALEELFYCNFYVRLSDYSFTAYKVQPYMLELLNTCNNAVEVANLYVKYMVADEFKEQMAEFLDFTTIKQRMRDVNTLGMNYDDPNIGPSTAIFTVVDRNEKGEVETLALVVAAIQY